MPESFGNLYLEYLRWLTISHRRQPGLEPASNAIDYKYSSLGHGFFRYVTTKGAIGKYSKKIIYKA